MKPVLIVGAGLSGATIARTLAEKEISSHVIDKRNHLAGNCHTSRDDETGIMVHRYGPHTFHTGNEEVWNFVNRFCEMVPYRYQVKTTYQGQVYSLPINLHTINQFFQKALCPTEAKAFIQSKKVPFDHEPRNFVEKALSEIGSELYEAFFKGYTQKQWGLDPKELPASVFSRLPIRYNYDDNYFFHRYQAQPRNGYTEMVENMLDHSLISTSLDTDFSEIDQKQYTHCFYSGPLDAYFNYSEGRLGYRTLDFELTSHEEDQIGNIVMNYADETVPHTRIVEHKYFTPWERHQSSVCITEQSRLCEKDDIPYYPLRLAKEKALLEKYQQRAKGEQNTTFVGRLGTYRYLDMDVTIKEALDTTNHFISKLFK